MYNPPISRIVEYWYQRKHCNHRQGTNAKATLLFRSEMKRSWDWNSSVTSILSNENFSIPPPHLWNSLTISSEKEWNIISRVEKNLNIIFGFTFWGKHLINWSLVEVGVKKFLRNMKTFNWNYLSWLKFLSTFNIHKCYA